MGSQFDSVWVPTLQGAFFSAYEGVMDESWTLPIVRKYTDIGEFMKLVDLGTVGAVRQFVGPRQVTSPKVYTLTQQNLPFELSMEIDIEDVNRDHLGMWETKAQEIGEKFADHINKLVIAQTIANPVCFDGANFFSTTHPLSPGVVQINDLSATQVPALAAATAAAPTAVEMSNIIAGIIGYQFTMLDEAGDAINGLARKFMVATSNPAVWESALSAIRAQQLSQGQTNPLWAGLLKNGYEVNAIIDPRLGAANSAVFYFYRTDSVVKSYAWGEEVPMHLQYLGEGSDTAVKQNKYFWGGKAVRSVGVGRYQHSFRCTLS